MRLKLGPSEIRCFLCRDLRGIIVAKSGASSMESTEEPGRRRWAHIVCINWIPDIYFEDEPSYAIRGAVDRRRFNYKCSICGVAEDGACIACDFLGGCSKKFHVRCAID